VVPALRARSRPVTLRAMRPLIALALASLATSTMAQDVFVQDQPLPDLELPTIDGTRTIRLSELKGPPTLLIQFASW